MARDINVPSAPGPSFSRILDASQASSLVIPGQGCLLEAEFHREGPDLVLVGADGSRVLITNFFATPTPPTLVTSAGAAIPPDLAAKLAGPVAPGQFAQSGAAQQHLLAIGKVDKATGTVEVLHPDGTRSTLQVGDIIFKGDVVSTKGDGAVGIVFADASTFSLGTSGRMVIDELIYDPDQLVGQSSLSVVKGAFSFVSGHIAKTAPDASTIKTPTMTIGIRGTSGAGQADDVGGTNTIVLLPDAGGQVGEILVFNAAGVQVINSSFQQVAVSSPTQPPSPPVVIERSAVQAQYGNALDHAPAPPPPGAKPQDLVPDFKPDVPQNKPETQPSPETAGENGGEPAAKPDSTAKPEPERPPGDLDKPVSFVKAPAPVEQPAPPPEPAKTLQQQVAAIAPPPSSTGALATTTPPTPSTTNTNTTPASDTGSGAPASGSWDLASPASVVANITALKAAGITSFTFSQAGTANFTAAQAAGLTFTLVHPGAAVTVTDSASQIAAVLGQFDRAHLSTVTVSDAAPVVMTVAEYSTWNTVLAGQAALTVTASSDLSALNLVKVTQIAAGSGISITLSESQFALVPASHAFTAIARVSSATLVAIADLAKIDRLLVDSGHSLTLSKAEFAIWKDRLDTADASATVIVTDVPTVLSDTLAFSGSEDQAVTVTASQLLAKASDPDNILSIANLTASGGTVVDHGNGSWTVTPAANVSGAVTLSYAVVTDEGKTTPATATLTVAAVADAPTLTATSTFYSVSEMTLDIQATLGDLDGSESLSVSISGLPDGVTLSAGTLQPSGAWLLNAAQLSGLKIAGLAAPAPLEIAAIATETAGGPAAITIMSFTVNPPSAPPIVTANDGMLSFDGSAGVVVPRSATFAGADDFSIAMWIKPTGVGGLLYQQNAYEDELGIYTAVDSTGVLTFAFDRQTTGGWDWKTTSAGAITLDEWSQVTFVKAGSECSIYVNGVPVHTSAIGASQLGANTSTNSTVFGADFHGSLDDLKLYNAGLTAAQASALATGGSVTAGLIGDWQFTSAADLNDLTGTNGPITLPAGVAWGEHAHFVTTEDGAMWAALEVVDPEGGAVTAAVRTGALHGTVILEPPGSGSWTYRPHTNFSGPDSFTLRFTDSAGAYTDKLVTVTVNPVADAPTIASGGSGTIAFPFGAEAVALVDDAVAVSDPDSTTFKRVVVSLEGGEPGDRLGLDLTGAFHVDGDLYYGDNVIGMVERGNGEGFGGDSQLTIRFVEGAGTAAIVRDVLRSLRFESAEGSVGTRSVNVTVTDASDLESAPYTRTISSGSMASYRFTATEAGLDVTDAFVEPPANGPYVVVSDHAPLGDGDSFAYAELAGFSHAVNGFAANGANWSLLGWTLLPWDNSLQASTLMIDGQSYMRAYHDETGNTVYIDSATVSATNLVPLNLDNPSAHAPTRTITLDLALPTGASAGAVECTAATVIDAQGVAHGIDLLWTNGGPEEWALAATPPQGAKLAVVSDGGGTSLAAVGRLDFVDLPQSSGALTMMINGHTYTFSTAAGVDGETANVFYSDPLAQSVGSFVGNLAPDINTAFNLEYNALVVDASAGAVTDDLEITVGGTAYSFADVGGSASATATALMMESTFTTLGLRAYANGSQLHIYGDAAMAFSITESSGIPSSGVFAAANWYDAETGLGGSSKTTSGAIYAEMADGSALVFRQFDSVDPVTVSGLDTLTCANGDPAVLQGMDPVFSDGFTLPAVSGVNALVDLSGGPVLPTTLSIDWANGATDMAGSSAIHLDLQGVHAGAEYQLSSVTQDGVASAPFLGYQVDGDGIVFAVFANGLTRPVFQIPVVTFTDPAALTEVALGVFSSSDGSGLPVLHSVEALADPVAAAWAAHALLGGDAINQGNQQTVTADQTLHFAEGDLQVVWGEGTPTLVGGSGRDVILCGSGDEVVAPNGGADTVDGGAGIDTLSFADSVASVTVDLLHAFAESEGSRSYVRGFENVIGSAQDDVLLGDAHDNTLSGGDGDDVLDGGDGSDTVSYVSAPGAVTVNLLAGTAAGGAGTDTLVAIESVIGSADTDVISGDTGANTLVGGTGNDILDGGAGNDLFVYHADFTDGSYGSGDGLDTITGGSGSDTLAIYGIDSDHAPGFGSDADAAVLYFGSTPTLRLEQQFGGNDGGIEWIEFHYTDGRATERWHVPNQAGSGATGDSDFLFGTGANDVSDAGAGNDRGFGATGNDTFLGGTGEDFFSGNDGADVIYGGDGEDGLQGGPGSDTLIGGLGGDNLDGHGGYGDGPPGNDVYVYQTKDDSKLSADASAWDRDVDFITGFRSGQDSLVLQGVAGMSFTLGSLAPGGADQQQQVALTVAAIKAGSVDTVTFFTDGTDGYLYVHGAGTGTDFDGTFIVLEDTTALAWSDLQALDAGGQLTLDGVDDYAQATGITLANQSFTWEFWANRASSGSNDFVLGQGTSSTGNGLQVGYSAGNIFSFSFYNVDMNHTDTSTNVGQWVHWAGSYDAATNQRFLYKNGVEVAHDTASADFQGTGPLMVGDTPWGGNDFAGQLDDLRIWSGVRSAQQIADNFDRALTGEEAGLTANWTFDTLNGSGAEDIAGHDNPLAFGVGSAAPVVENLPGTAALFTADGARIQTSAAASTEVNNITLEAWARQDSQDGGMQLIAYTGNTSTSGWGLALDDNGHPIALLGGVNILIANTTTIPTGEWHHYALVRASGTWSLYVDGVAATLSGTTTITPNAISGPTFIGGNPTLASETFLGAIADVRLWEVARGQSDLQAHMGDRLTGAESGLAGYWPLDNDQFTDHTASPLNGIPTGAVSLVNTGPVLTVTDSPGIADSALETTMDAPLNGQLVAKDGVAWTAVNYLATGHGTISVAANGCFIYKPAIGFTGSDTFTVTATSGGVSTPKTFTVEVTSDIAVLGGSGNDLLTGSGAGNDTLIGGAGNDMLIGGGGNDTVIGGDGSDTAVFSGNAGQYDVTTDGGYVLVTDTIVGDGATHLTSVESLQFQDRTYDYLVAGTAGADQFTIHSAVSLADTLVVGGAGDDTLTVSYSAALMDSDFANLHSIERLILGATAAAPQSATLGASSQVAGLTTMDASAAIGTVTVDASNRSEAMTLLGGTGTDTVTGGAGNDILFGNAGNDTINGGAGNDIINGGVGSNPIAGGAGADDFVLEKVGTAIIQDWSQADDQLVLPGAQYDLGNAGTLAAGQYVEPGQTLTGIGANFGSGAGIIGLQNGANVELFFSANLSDASTGNSYQIAVLEDRTLDDVNAADLKLTL